MLHEELLQPIDRDRLDYIEHQCALFEVAKPLLLVEYFNEYVAFENGDVLDHDLDRKALAQRIYTKYGYRDFLMRKVTSEDRVYSIGGFRTSKVSAE